eukprot:GFYU01013412.1.p1 GENE.GFYU01013412.1~~GFYU01013412.1.p1  ORF type:complete len:447 (-),score=77.71 GFYU01013412.1:294-1634(-)
MTDLHVTTATTASAPGGFVGSVASSPRALSPRAGHGRKVSDNSNMESLLSTLQNGEKNLDDIRGQVQKPTGRISIFKGGSFKSSSASAMAMNGDSGTVETTESSVAVAAKSVASTYYPGGSPRQSPRIPASGGSGIPQAGRMLPSSGDANAVRPSTEPLAPPEPQNTGRRGTFGAPGSMAAARGGRRPEMGAMEARRKNTDVMDGVSGLQRRMESEVAARWEMQRTLTEEQKTSWELQREVLKLKQTVSDLQTSLDLSQDEIMLQKDMQQTMSEEFGNSMADLEERLASQFAHQIEMERKEVLDLQRKYELSMRDRRKTEDRCKLLEFENTMLKCKVEKIEEVLDAKFGTNLSKKDSGKVREKFNAETDGRTRKSNEGWADPALNGDGAAAQAAAPAVAVVPTAAVTEETASAAATEKAAEPSSRRDTLGVPKKGAKAGRRKSVAS